MLDLKSYAALDCTDIIRLIGRGELSTVEVWNAARDALAEVAAWNVAVELYSAPSTPPPTGLLRGVPMIHKDSASGSIEGLPAEYSSRLLAGCISSKTSHLMACLLEEGCQVVARGKVPEMALSMTGDNAVMGSVPNPFNPDFSAGGSTAAIAAIPLGAVPLVQGGDAGGSLRIPASWAGCYSMKATTGIISASPVGNQLCGIDESFVATRSLRDLRLMLNVLSRPSKDDFSHPPSEPSFYHKDPSSRTIGFVPYLFADVPVDSSHLSAARDLSVQAQNLGFVVEDLRLDLDFEAYCEALYVIFSSDLRSTIESLPSGIRSRLHDLTQPYIAKWYEDSADLSSADLFVAVDHVRKIARRISAIFSRYDVLISPVTGQPPPRIDTLHLPHDYGHSRDLNRRFEEIVHFCGVFNMSGHPSLCIPASFSKCGVPCGVQLVGRPGAEGALIQLAELVDRGFQKAPGFLG